MTIGERRIDPEGWRLLHATVEAVAAAYKATVDLPGLGEPVIGLVQQVYWDSSDPSHWVPATLAIFERKAEWCAEHGRAEALWWPYELDGDMESELPTPDLDDDPELKAVCQQLLEFVTTREADELVGPYFMALATRLHELFGMPVVTEDPDGGVVEGTDEQALAQLTAEQRTTWAARGWIELDPQPELHPDTVLHVPVARARAAGIYRHGNMLFATNALGPYCGGVGLEEPVTALGGDPGVVAGMLPPGATKARVQDLYDRWHDAQTAEGAWLAVLPHEGRGGPPPVEFLAADGSVVERVTDRPREVVSWTFLPGEADVAEPVAEQDWLAEVRAVLANATVTPLWPAGHHEAPELRGWSGDDERATAVTLGAETLEVHVDRDELSDDPETAARETVEEHLALQIGRRAAARATIEAPTCALPGTIEGRPETFALVAPPGAWAAAWRNRRTELLVTVRGTGEPPAQLDLVPAPDSAG